MAKEIIHIDEIGEVHFNRDNRFKRLALKMNSRGEIHLTSPASISIKDACKFVVAHKQRILKWGAVMQAEQIIFTEQTNFKTFAHTLKIIRHNGKTARMSIVNKELRVAIPAHLDIKSKSVQEAIKKCLIHTLKVEGKSYLPQRTLALAAKHNFQVNKTTVKEIRSRWGSCSSHKNINLSCFLMLLPAELIDYIILHELCHTIEMNHGPRFHALMDKVTGGKEDTFRKALKKHRIFL